MSKVDIYDKVIKYNIKLKEGRKIKWDYFQRKNAIYVEKKLVS
jgi:hypothetical protein